MKYNLIYLLSVLLLLIGFGCKKTDNFYNTEKSIPQLNLNTYTYHSAYAIGDTMILTGQLNPNDNLQITIGGAKAPIVKTITNVPYNAIGGQTYQMDQVSVVITPAMGIGPNRPVTVSTGGFSVQGPVIYIFEPIAPVLKDSLKLINYYQQPQNSIFLNCVNGKGSIYYYSANTIQYLPKGGSLVKLLDLTNLHDNLGHFNINSFYCGGVDPQEMNLYFSALTTDNTADNASNNIYRLCKYAITTQTLTVLNRTLIPKSGSSASSFEPFEGNLSQVKIPAVSGINPDSKGGLYLQLNNGDLYNGLLYQNPYAITYVDGTNQLTYKLHVPNDGSGQNYPQAFNTPVAVAQMPGGALTVSPSSGVPYYFLSPDDNVIYAGPPNSVNSGLGSDGISECDLNTGVLLGKVVFTRGNTGIPSSVIGPFNTLNVANTMIGLLPLTGEKTIFFFNQENGGPMPRTWLMLDFKQQQSYLYAPGSCVMGIGTPTPYYLSPGTGNVDNDILLNYDQDGQLYMTVNQRMLIVKTSFQ